MPLAGHFLLSVAINPELTDFLYIWKAKLEISF